MLQSLAQSCSTVLGSSHLQDFICTLVTKHLPISFSLRETKHCFRELMLHIVSDWEEDIWKEQSPLVRTLRKSLWSRSARRCCLLSGNQLILRFPLHVSRFCLKGPIYCLKVELLFKRGKEWWGKKAVWLLNIRHFHSTCMSCYETWEKIKQPRPEVALVLPYAIIVTGSLYSGTERIFLKFNNCFHDTDVYWTVFITL